MVRAKFRCDEVAKTVSGQTVRMSPVTSNGGEENAKFFKYTPFGKLEMGTINQDIVFEPGKEYYLDFTPAK
jgi:hypothetical protein